jgi:HEAT repeat protein
MKPTWFCWVWAAWACEVGIAAADQPEEQAIAELTKAGARSQTDALLDALALGLPPRVAAAALDALAARHDRRGADVALAYLKHRDPGVRAHAVLTIAALDDPRAREAVRRGLGDVDRGVRAAAARAAVQRRDAAAVPALLALLARGDQAAAPALAALADGGAARKVTGLAGAAPDAAVAACLGGLLLRKDLGPDDLYVELVRALGGLPGDGVLAALNAYLGSLPATSNRPSRREAQAFVAARTGAER